MKRFKVISWIFATFAIIAFASPAALAESGFFSRDCAGCHSDVSSTCDGCHAHGVHSSNSKSDLNLTGSTDKNDYAPGETVVVTIDGGYRSGWVRATLYDENMAELARSAGAFSMGGGPGLPVTLSAAAPSAAGTYVWYVAWYGNAYDMDQEGGSTVFGRNWRPDQSNPNHGEEVVAINAFTVTGGGEPVPPAPKVVDLDIANISVSKRVSLTRVKPVTPKLTVKNPGTAAGTADATLTGTQGGSQFYQETVTVTVPAGGRGKVTFPSYVPTSTGTISWSVILEDVDPDFDQATAATKVVQ